MKEHYLFFLEISQMYYVSDLGDQWGPMILNFQEEMNVTIVTNPDPVILSGCGPTSPLTNCHPVQSNSLI